MTDPATAALPPAKPGFHNWHRNERLGIWNGWAIFGAEGFLNVSVVLAGFAARLGAPNWVIGLLPAIAYGGWHLPQLFVASRVGAMAYKLPLYRSAAFVRTGSYVAMVAVAALLADQPALCLSLFLLAMFVNALSSGISGLPFLEVVSKTVPSARRPWFFATRNLYGGLLALCAGLTVRFILGSSLAFPYNYALIFGLGVACAILGYWLFGLVDEPPDVPQHSSGTRSELATIPQTLADPDFRAFLQVRLLLAAASISEPFYATYALRELHFSQASLGTFVMAVMFAAPFSNLLWQRIAEKRGSRHLIRSVCVVAGLAPLWALLVGSISWTAIPHGQLWAYLGVFLLSSMAAQGFNLGFGSYLLNIAPQDHRSRYIGTFNTLVGIALFLPVAGGLLADQAGYRWVFGASIVFTALAWGYCARLRRDA